MKRKILMYPLISLCIFLGLKDVSAIDYINYYNISMNEEEYNNLIELGFSENEIYYMDQESFDYNKNIESTLVAENQKYYKTIYETLNGTSYTIEISKNEFDNQSNMNTRGTVQTAYKTMVTTMSRQSTNKFRYKVSVGWTSIPTSREYDIIGIGFDDDVHIDSFVNISHTYCDPSDNCTTSTLYHDMKELATGASAVYKVPDGDIRALTIVLYYDVSKDSSAPIYELNMYGDYAHAMESINGREFTDHTINCTGIQLFGSIINKYDEIPAAQSTWYGTW